MIWLDILVIVASGAIGAFFGWKISDHEWRLRTLEAQSPERKSA